MRVHIKAPDKSVLPTEMWEENNRYFLQFPFNRSMINFIKTLSNYKWHGFEDPPRKIWSVANNRHNRFVLSYIIEEFDNPYAPYLRWSKGDREHIGDCREQLFNHQRDLISHALTVKHGIWAAEMGTGKTLAAIELMERAKKWFDIPDSQMFYISPKSIIGNVKYEIEKWQADVSPVFSTYEGLVKRVKEWEGQAPRLVIFDESSKVKTHNAQRSQAAMHLANGIRDDWVDEDTFIILMTGTPAPKKPTDWWNQCEIACPGYIKEGSPTQLEGRLALVEWDENQKGSSFPKVITWFDDENKCGKCGYPKEWPIHKLQCDFKPSVNEVNRLYRLLNSGLVEFVKKADCLDLPDKIYRQVKVEPTKETLRLQKLILKTSTRAVTALTLCRELSDGFQYVEGQSEEVENCPRCAGTGLSLEFTDDNEPVREPCINCEATGEIPKKTREVHEVDCPKDDALKDLLDEYSEVGRVVIYAGFQGSIDRVVQTVTQEGWDVIRLDGRGWHYYGSKDICNDDLVREFQEGTTPNLAFVAQPGAGGYGFTLTASPVIIYYSNTFVGEHRSQSEDRIHRPGMDVNRGATIVDIIHLDTDELVLKNIKEKRRLETMTMGELHNAINSG